MKDIDLKEVNDPVEFEAAQTLGEEFPPGEYEDICELLDQTRQREGPDYCFVVGDINAYLG